MSDLREEPWFFQELPPDLAIAILQSLETGTFLVRSFKKRLSLSLVVQDNVRHFWIHQYVDGRCYIHEPKRFLTIQEMVMYYSEDPGLGSQLGRYPDKENLDKLWLLDSIPFILTDVISEQSLPFIVKSGRYGDKAVTGFVSKFKHSMTEINVLRNEGRLWMTLDNENIAKFIGILTNDTSFTILGEQCSGGSLLNFLSYRNDSLQSEWEFLVIAGHQIANGTNYLHRKGIVHNEMILENWGVLLDPFIVRLTSFHHATFEDTLSSSLLRHFSTRYSRLLLKPPELNCLLADQEQLPTVLTTCQSDLWGLGLLYWRLFHLGQSPPSDPVRVDQLVTSSWPAFPPDLCAAVDRIIQSCLHEVPQLRMTTFEILKEFRVLLELKKMQRRGVIRLQPPISHAEGESSIEAGFSSGSNAPSLDVAAKPERKLKKKRRFLQQLRTARIVTPSPKSTSSVENYNTTANKSESPRIGAANGFIRGLRSKLQLPGLVSSIRHRKQETKEPSSHQIDPTDLIASDVSLEDLTSATGNITLSYEQLLGVAKTLSSTVKHEKRNKEQMQESLKQSEVAFAQKMNSLTLYYQTKLDDSEFRLQECEADNKNMNRALLLQEKAYEERLIGLKEKLVRLEKEKVSLELELGFPRNQNGCTSSKQFTSGSNEPVNDNVNTPTPVKAELLNAMPGFHLLRLQTASSPFSDIAAERRSVRRNPSTSPSSFRQRDQRFGDPPTLPPHRPSPRQRHTRQKSIERHDNFLVGSPLVPKRSSSKSSDSEGEEIVPVIRVAANNHKLDTIISTNSICAELTEKSELDMAQHNIDPIENTDRIFV